MSPTIRIDDEVFARLKNMGEAFVDTPNSVLRRVLELEDNDPAATEQKLTIREEKPENVQGSPRGSGSITTYSHPRFCFKSSFIEPLSDEDVFQVKTAKNGIFRFTKAEFYRVFPNVIKSVSYRENGIYHYPTVPRKALAYRVG